MTPERRRQVTEIFHATRGVKRRHVRAISIFSALEQCANERSPLRESKHSEWSRHDKTLTDPANCSPLEH